MSQERSEMTMKAEPALVDYINELVTIKVAERFDAIREQIERAVMEARQSSKPQLANRATIVVFSSDMDKLIAAFIISTGAAAMGMEASMYFTFWGLSALKRRTALRNKTITEKLMGLMLPAGLARLGTSKMNMLGMGPAFLKYVMKKKNIQTLPDLIALAADSGVRMVACQMSMDVMGITKEELIDGVGHGGVATYLGDACDSRITLFI
jgi:peroxiredoxin family protein